MHVRSLSGGEPGGELSESGGQELRARESAFLVLLRAEGGVGGVGGGHWGVLLVSLGSAKVGGERRRVHMCRSLGVEEDMRDSWERSREGMRISREAGLWNVLGGVICSLCSGYQSFDVIIVHSRVSSFHISSVVPSLATSEKSETY